MIPPHIVRKAIEGGWERKTSNASYEYEIACDPAFWGAIGKELGWPKGKEKIEVYDNPMIPRLEVEIWKVYALNFFDLLLTSGDTSAFWQSISDKK